MNPRSGHFVQVGSGLTAYQCFVPQPLPPQNPALQYDDEMIYLLAEANRLVGRLDEVTDNLISPGFFVTMYARKEATLSSQIEGTQATFSDLIKAEAGLDSEVPDDVKEIENYVRAIEYGYQRLAELPLSLRLIREIHSILMTDVRGQDKSPGEFRTSQNWIGGYSINTATYVPPAIPYMTDCLNYFEKYLHEEDQMSPLIKAALIHCQFEMIHPFLDGNGRVGRLLITFFLAAKGILHKPTLYLSRFIKQHQKAYYQSLFEIQTKGDFESWVKYFLTGIIESSNEAVRIAREIAVIRTDDIRKINSLGRTSENAFKIFEGLFDKPTITIEEAAKKLEISVPTSTRLLDKLCDEGILASFDQRKRKKVFVYKRYMDAFSKD